MQKDIQKSKGETQQQKFDQPKQEATSKEGHKLKQVGHDINAGLKENVGVGVGNYSSGVDREKSEKHEKKYDEKKEKEELKKKGEKFEKKGERIGERRDQKEGETGPFSHKVQEIGHTVNANLKQNVGIGLGNYSSEVDREKATEHRVKYEDKKEVEKEKLEEKKEEMKEKFQGGETGIYGHRLQEVGHTLNANLKENIGIGIGDYSSEVDRQKATEHRELYEEKVKEECKPEVTDSSTIGHKIKEVAHTVNANLKEMIGIGLGNYSSEVDRELASIHKEKYEEKVQTTTKHEDFPKEGECKDREFKDRESKNLESKDRESKDREFKDREFKDRESKNLESKNLESKDRESKDRKKEETCLHNDDKCTHTKEERGGLHSKEAKFDDKQKTGSGDNKL